MTYLPALPSETHACSHSTTLFTQKKGPFPVYSAEMEWKKQNKTYQILEAAEKGQYGVVAAIA